MAVFELPPTSRRAILARVKRAIDAKSDGSQSIKKASSRECSSCNVDEGTYFLIESNIVRDMGDLGYFAEKFDVLRDGEKIEP